MRLSVLRFLLVLPLLECLPQPPAAAQSEAPPVAITNRVDLHYDVQADGQYTEILHIERRAGTDAAARSLRVFPWEYSPSHEQVESITAYTLKANGEKIPIDSGLIRDQAPDPSARTATLTDDHAKLIPFLELTAGDSIVVDLREHVSRPRLPGIFSVALLYDRTQAWDDARVSVTVPDSITLRSEAVGLTASGPESGTGAPVHNYSWRYHNTEIVRDDPGVLAPVERLPRLLITSAADWNQIGHAYAALALPQAAVTPLIQKTADAQAAAFNDHRAIAEQLFDWVRDNINYQAVPFGQSNVTPESADAVLKARTGDSGDEAVLLSALLAAKGIASDLVLIDVDNVYRLSVPVPFAQLNHVMLYLPEFSAYADPTETTSRIGALPFDEYGKPVVYAVATGDAVHATPILAPNAATLTFTTTAHLTNDGVIAGDSGTVATGPFALSLLRTAQVILSEGADNAGTGQIHAEGDRGTGKFELPPVLASNGGELLAGHFEVSAWPHISADYKMSLPEGLRAQARAGDVLIGPLDPTIPADAPTPCFAGRESESTTLDLGDKYRVVHLPEDRTIEGDAFKYTSHWSSEGSVVAVHRALVSRVTQPLCEGKLRQQAAAALHGILDDYSQQVSLQPVAPKAATPVKTGTQ